VSTIFCAILAPILSFQEERGTDTDASLVMRALEGDRRAFDCIVQRHNGWIYALSFRILRSADKARDVSQETFLRAFAKLSTLLDRDKLGGWLKSIALNQCRSVIDRENIYEPFGVYDEMNIVSGSSNPEQSLLVNEQKMLVEELIDRLNPKQRLVFVMKYIDGYTYRQIVELTGFSENEVKSYLQNACRNFEKWFRAKQKKNKWHLRK
jgi:RNA polymerase sigma-70 factor (ECF subfamily)